MFNSIGRSSNFAQAGKSAADDMVRSFAAARRNSPDYGKLAETAATIRSQEKQAAMKAQAAVAKTGIQAAGEVKATKVKTKAEGELKGARRKAGALATAGKFFNEAGTLYGDSKDINLRDTSDSAYEQPGKQTAQEALETAIKNSELVEQGINPETGKSYGVQTDTETTDTSTTNGGATPPKVPVAAGNSGQSLALSSGNSGGSLAQSYGKNWYALQTVIRKVEGTKGEKGYNTRFGGHQFEGFEAHPNIAAATPWGTESEAAGAFQFMKPTWDRAAKDLGLTDFTPESQQKAGRYLTQGRGVNPDADLSDFNVFASSISKLSPEWAGLPNSTNGRTGYHGQANADMQELHKLYLQTLNGL